MDLVLVAFLALSLGATFGVVLGLLLARSARAQIEARRRALAGAASGFAILGLDTLPERSAADLLSGVVRVILGGVPYDLPVLTRRENREWLAGLDERFASLADAIDASGDDVPRILSLLTGHTDWMLATLQAYDRVGLLPDSEYLDEFATDAEILRATVGVWRAANPLAAILAAGAAEATDGTSSEPSSSSPSPTDTDSTRSTIG